MNRQCSKSIISARRWVTPAVIVLTTLLVIMIVAQGPVGVRGQIPDLVSALPGQPRIPQFAQYAGYVSLGPSGRKKFFYSLMEATSAAASKPLILWLNGGPGCSSFGYGLFEEIGPWKVKDSTATTLVFNPYAWNQVANVLVVESPAGVGFSSSSLYSDYITGDAQTATDNFDFLAGFIAKHTRYQNRPFFIFGESYAGHYIPQLAQMIVSRQSSPQRLKLTFKGFAVGNAFTEAAIDDKATADFLYWHGALNTEEYNSILQTCTFKLDYSGQYGQACTLKFNINKALSGINPYGIYADICLYSPFSSYFQEFVKARSFLRASTLAIGGGFAAVSNGNATACRSDWTSTYLNSLAVQRALNVIPKTSFSIINWQGCSYFLSYSRNDFATSVVPTVRSLLSSRISILFFSGDVDSVVPFTGTRQWIEALKLPVLSSITQWFDSSGQVGGWVTKYQGLTFNIVRGAGHLVPVDQPSRAFLLFKSFVSGKDVPT